MKNILFLLALIVSFASCKKENIEPTPEPTAQTSNESFDKYVVVHQSGFDLDSAVIQNTTTGTSETVTANISSIDCGVSTDVLVEFPLSSTASSGDILTVTIYHNSFTWGGVSISDFLANSSTVLCDELGGNSGNQLSSGTSTVLNFSVE